MSTGLARVTVNAPGRRVDVALPEQVPLVELLPDLLRHAGEGLADDGERHGGWVLRRADGVTLTTGQGLQPQGVRDGEVLHLVPARAQWPELAYDDVVEAIADSARRGAAWSGQATRTATLVGAGALLAVGLIAVLRGGPTWPVGAYLGLAVAVLLTLAASVASRAYGDRLVGATLAGLALPYAFVGGALLVATGDPIGVLGPVRWLGGPELLVGSVALLLVATLGVAGVAAGLRVLAAGVLVGLLGALTALVGFALPAAGTAAILTAVLVCGIGVLPLLAIRLGRLPMPPITLPAGAEGFTTVADAPDPARERPDRARVHAAAVRTAELLTGLLIGHALLAVVAAVILVVAGGTAGRLLVAVAAAALLLRARLFVSLRQRVPLLVAGLAGVVVLGAALTTDAGQGTRLGLAVGGAVLALLTVTAGTTYSRRPPSPYFGRAADLLDTLSVVSVVPIACAVLGLYAHARDLLV